VKVTDFGIARAGPSEMTETGTIVGTAHYLSPEQAQGQPVDERSDLYSVGVMLYETLTGRVPFDADSTVSIALQHVSEPPVPPSQVNPTVPPELDAVVLRALEKDPERRFQDADEFIAALEAPASAVAAAPPVVAEPVERRRWWLWLLLALLLLALAAGAYLLLSGKTVTVPDVVGQRSSEAADRLQSRGLEVDVEPVRSDDVPRDRVVRQDPRAGEEVDEGSTVTIAVSAGPGETEVPDVVGDRREAAERELTEAGFKVDVTRAFDDEVERGRVVSTSPEPGTVAERGSEVALRVSRGPEQVTVPDVTGRGEDDARATLEDAGLQVESGSEASPDQDPGTVLRQDPEAGAEVERGSTVTIVVAEAPPPVSVPDVIELDEEAARAELESAGFTVRVRDEPVDGPDEDGTVLDQTPGPGEEADPGSRVTIVVGRFEPDLDPDPGADPDSGAVEPGA
jgi:serine/threonine-protein kinase